MTINCNGRLLDLSTPIVMGVLNVTPDSFHKGSRVSSVSQALTLAHEMVEAGAKILDVGAMSSRPGAEIISTDEELSRILPILKSLKKELPDTIFSIDTVRAKVAEACLDHGAHIINDISGASIDGELVEVIVKYKSPYILMHMKGLPNDMQSKADYDNVTMDVIAYMHKHITYLKSKGVQDIIIDPGFGFAKLDHHNFQLMREMNALQMFDCPILAGISRKSTIQRTLDVDADHALNGSIALHMYLLERGANILRVHDVLEAVEVVKLWKQLQK